MTCRQLLWAVALVAGAAGCKSKETARTDELVPEPMAVEPTGEADVAPERGYIGVLAPREAVEITAPFTTNVDSYTVNLGDHVEAGTPLALLDEAPLREQLAVAEAELKGFRAEVTQAAAARQAAKRNVKEDKQGVRSGIVSRSALADSESKLREAGGLVSGAVAKVEQQKARIAALASKLEDMTLTSPIAGKVALRYVEAGHRVDEGRPIVRVISSEELLLKFAIPPEHVGRVKPGDVVEVFIKERGAKASAKVTSIAPEIDPVARAILGEAELVDPIPDQIQSGMSCRVTIAGKAEVPPAPPAPSAPTSPPAPTPG
jgi:RND family efflux transporter MFP subunit